MNNAELHERIRVLTHPISTRKTGHDIKLQTLENIRCVALDFYGTIVISDAGDIGIDEAQKDNQAHFDEALKSSGFTILKQGAGEKGISLFDENVEVFIAEAKNRGIDYPEPDVRSIWPDVLQTLIEESYISGNVTDQSAKLFGVEFEFRINKIWPVPDLKKVLQELVEHDLSLGIISNSQFYTPIAFETFLGNSLQSFGFNENLLVWSFKKGRKKPSPHFYQHFVHAAVKEDINPQEILYVGNDIRKDIEPAKALGLKTALFVGDERSIRHNSGDLNEKRYQPDLIINDLHQILDCLSF